MQFNYFCQMLQKFLGLLTHVGYTDTGLDFRFEQKKITS